MPAASTAPDTREMPTTSMVAPQAPTKASTGRTKRLRRGERHQQRDGGAQRRAAGRAQQIRLGQGIAEHALEDRAAQSEQRADQRRRQHARDAPFDQQAAAQIAGAGDRAEKIGRRRPLVAGTGGDQDGQGQGQDQERPGLHWLGVAG